MPYQHGLYMYELDLTFFYYSDMGGRGEGNVYHIQTRTLEGVYAMPLCLEELHSWYLEYWPKRSAGMIYFRILAST